MSYTPTEWKTGDVITAEKLNKLEGGVAQAGIIFVLNEIRDTEGRRLSMKFGDIVALVQNGKVPLVVSDLESDGRGYLFCPCYTVECSLDGGGYIVTNIDGTDVQFEAASNDEYPAVITGG